MPKYEVDGIVKGKVTGIENYGIFIITDDEYTGLIHISEVSDNFVKNIYDYVELNDYIFAKIIAVDNKTKKLKLSIKNFDYRNGKEICENDTNGFEPLKEMLPKWVSDYKKENFE